MHAENYYKCNGDFTVDMIKDKHCEHSCPHSTFAPGDKVATVTICDDT